MTSNFKLTRFAELRPTFEQYCELIDAAAATADDRAADALLRKADQLKAALEAFMGAAADTERSCA